MIFALLGCLYLAQKVPLQGTPHDALSLVDVLDTSFDVALRQEASASGLHQYARGTFYEFKSKEKLADRNGKMASLRLDYSCLEYASFAEARKAFFAMGRKKHKVGHQQLVQVETSIYTLWAPCSLSETQAEQLFARLLEIVSNTDTRWKAANSLCGNKRFTVTHK